MIWAMYFSATGTTERIVTEIAGRIDVSRTSLLVQRVLDPSPNSHTRIRFGVRAA